MNKTNLVCGILFSGCAVGELALTITIAKELKKAYDLDKHHGTFPESVCENLAIGLICGGAVSGGLMIAAKFTKDAIECFRHLKN